jgi:YhcH/YjgK/YiaL family protein
MGDPRCIGGMALFGPIMTVRAQAPQPEKFAATFAYLEALFRPGSPESVRLLATPVGETHRYELADGAFAMEQVYRSKLRPDGFFESHRRYIDVQVIFEGEEWMEVADLTRGAERLPYNPDRDLIVWHDIPSASRLNVRAGDAAIFYPADVHMPGLCPESGQAIVRKTVIKVPV